MSIGQTKGMYCTTTKSVKVNCTNLYSNIFYLHFTGAANKSLIPRCMTQLGDEFFELKT